MRSGIVLVGGEARRAGGMEKYFFEVCGRTFIDRLLETLRGVVDEIIIVARDEEQCRRFDPYPYVRCTPDMRRGLGPIGGLHAGCLAARGEAVFVVACDMPCINGEVIEALFERLGERDAVIPCWDREMYEPPPRRLPPSGPDRIPAGARVSLAAGDDQEHRCPFRLRRDLPGLRPGPAHLHEHQPCRRPGAGQGTPRRRMPEKGGRRIAVNGPQAPSVSTV